MFEKFFNKKEKNPSQVVIKDVLNVKKGERVLIIANPATNQIAQDLYTASCEEGAETALIFQPDRTSFDNALPEVIAAIKTNPDVCLSISNIKLGKDSQATAEPYKTEDGKEFTHIFDYLLEGKKTMRAAWTPGITQDMMNRTAPIDYHQLKNRCKEFAHCFKNAKSLHVTTAMGTDIRVPVTNRNLMFDDGDFSKAGKGGNIPAGEVFISPLVGKGENPFDADYVEGCQGVIVFDGSMTFYDGDGLLKEAIICQVKNGYVSEISGGEEANRLLKTITNAEKLALQMEKDGKLPAGQGDIYKKNARNIGELGIGLNPSAEITGNMLEDEKAFHTCHFAIGENYDNDAPALIHLDGVVKNPTITITYLDGSEKIILKDGNIII